MKIVAVGGGEIGRIKIHADGTREQKPVETLAIDKKIIELSGKTAPNILFLGTASDDSADYLTAVYNHFNGRLGCQVMDLKLAKDNPSEKDMRIILDKTDIIYVGGGNTTVLLDAWKRTGFDKLVREYGERGIILSGVSAGAICWFDYYDNDEEESILGADGKIDWAKLDTLPGLGFIKGFAVPHYNTKSAHEKQSFNNMLIKKGIFGYAIDNGAAILFDNGKISTITSQPNMDVHYLNMPKQNIKERD